MDGGNVHEYDRPDRFLKLHVSNIQLLASIDSALALVTLIFNCRQLVSSITNVPLLDENPEALYPDDVFISPEGSVDINLVSEAELGSESDPVVDESLYYYLIAGSVASLCLTLTQLLLACLVMVFLSYISGDVNGYAHHDPHVMQRRARVIAGVWVAWSGLLFIVLVIYVLSMKRFEASSDKIYLFMLISEIVLRVVIINYTTLFFCCRGRLKCT